MGFKTYYTTNINDPRIRRWYDAYRKKLGLPIWCPMSDQERWDFDAKVIPGSLNHCRGTSSHRAKPCALTNYITSIAQHVRKSKFFRRPWAV